MMDYSTKIALAGLEIGAMKISTANPFEWASGYKMPIYNDNRMFLYYPEYRKLISDAYIERIKEKGIKFNVIAGTSTAGISPGTTLADRLEKPFVYIRDKQKEHGLRNKIEGIDVDSNLNGKITILIEDLISTGGSSVNAIQSIRNANGICNHCLSIFNYGFNEAQDTFDILNPKCNVESLLYYQKLLEVAISKNKISEEQLKILKEWREDPFNWGEKHGFPRVIKK